MKRLRVFLLVLLPAFSAAFAEQALRPRVFDSIFGADKGHHFAACAVICAAAHYGAVQEFGMSRTTGFRVSVGVAFAVGAAKEIYDKRSGRGRASWLDLAADTMGIVFAGLLLNLPFQ